MVASADECEDGNSFFFFFDAPCGLESGDKPQLGTSPPKYMDRSRAFWSQGLRTTNISESTPRMNESPAISRCPHDDGPSMQYNYVEHTHKKKNRHNGS